jgi:hypothetical protein
MADDLSDIRASLATGDGRFDPSEVVVIGVHMDPKDPEHFQKNKSPEDLTDNDKKAMREYQRNGCIKVTNELLDTITITAEAKKKDSSDVTDPTVAVIYAYAFEGHTYRLPKPRLMIVSGFGDEYDTEVDSAASKRRADSQLYMWRMSKHAQSISIELETGTIQTLLLDGNEPGNRSVTSYHSHMQLSHRGGRLT